ncbi:MAG TPA: hypothetical protein VMU41_04270 [Candidatus Binataceae bacterium]|nr:hypothetical protein [Candidatus Binataceae bacterium]
MALGRIRPGDGLDTAGDSVRAINFIPVQNDLNARALKQRASSR